MAYTFGAENAALTAAIKRVAKNSENVQWSDHALDEMDNDGFDQMDVLTCLRKGSAYGPENVNRESRANVLHRGLKIRVAVAPATKSDEWEQMSALRVITVMRMRA